MSHVLARRVLGAWSGRIPLALVGGVGAGAVVAFTRSSPSTPSRVGMGLSAAVAVVAVGGGVEADVGLAVAGTTL